MGVVDLKGNTNFVLVKSLKDPTTGTQKIVVPRTNLAAVDMDVANGLTVFGNTMSVNLATAEDIEHGTSGHLIDAAGIKPFLTDLQVVAGEGTIVTGSTVDTNRATVEETLTGATVAADKTVSVEALKGALSSGKAVDVTSEPDQIITGDYKGTFTTTDTTLGFAAFPKFASNLVYLMRADVTVDTARNITPSGTWLDGTTTAKALPANTPTRIAMLFTSSADTCAATLTFSGSGTVTVTKLREFEVTGCSDAARSYIASMENPDDFTKFYLVDYDEQNPWTYIIDMKTSQAVTLMAGLSYKLDATTGTHTITTDTCPVGYNGEDAHLTLFVGLSGNIIFQSPLNLIDPLTPGAGHNITVKFRDGQANAYVDDTDIGYVVTVNSGTDSGSLYYALTANSDKYVVFANNTDGTPVDFNNVVTGSAEKIVVGNGYTQTTLTGSAAFTGKTTFTNVGMDGVVVTGGTTTLGNVYIPEGGTITTIGGSGLLVLEKVTGGGTFLPGSKGVYTPRGSVFVSGCTFTGSDRGTGSGTFQLGYNVRAELKDVLITGNTAKRGGGMMVLGGDNVDLSSCTISGNVATDYGPDLYLLGSGTVNLFDTTLGKTAMQGDDSLITMSGACDITWITQVNPQTAGSAVISSGAAITLGSVIKPGVGVTFLEGGATIIPGGSSAIAYTLGGMTVPQIGNTNVVNLNSTNVVISSGGMAYASGCTFSGGSATYGGCALVSGMLYMNDCIVSGNSASYDTLGNGIAVAVGASATLSGTTVRSNGTDGDVMIGGSMSIIGGCDIHSIHNGGLLVIAGSNKIDVVTTRNNGGVIVNGSVTVSSGASITLTSSIAPGGDITLHGGAYSDPTTIFYSSGGVSESRTFSELDITGSTINSMGLIYGATIYAPTGVTVDHNVLYTTDNGATSSSTIIYNADIPYVVAGALLGISNT